MDWNPTPSPEEGSLPGYPDMDLFLDASRRELTVHGTEAFPCAGYTDRYRDAFLPWHWHDELELGFVEEGTMEAHVNDRHYVLTKGCGIFVNSGVLHAYSGSGGGTCRFPNVLFHASLIYGDRKSVFFTRYVRPVLEAACLSHLILTPHVAWQEEAIEQIRCAHRLFLCGGVGYECRIRNVLTDFILLLFTHCAEQIFSSAAPGRPEVHRVRQMMDYIAGRYTQPISVGEIAHSALVSERECLRCFRQVTGTSPRQYVMDLRIRRARELLAGSALTLMEVGEACGFQGQSYFIRLFRRYMGMTPGQYRRLCLERADLPETFPGR